MFAYYVELAIRGSCGSGICRSDFSRDALVCMHAEGIATEVAPTGKHKHRD